MKAATVCILLGVFLSFVQGQQYTVVTYFPGELNCGGASHRVEYKVNQSCVEEGCFNVGNSSRFYSCGNSVSVAPNTVEITSYSTPDCSGAYHSVGVYPQNVCIVGSTGYSKINCNGTYSCTDILCNDCVVTPLPDTCKQTKSGGSSFYVCYPSSSPSPSPSSSSASFVSLSIGCILVFLSVLIL